MTMPNNLTPGTQIWRTVLGALSLFFGLTLFRNSVTEVVLSVQGFFMIGTALMCYCPLRARLQRGTAHAPDDGDDHTNRRLLQLVSPRERESRDNVLVMPMRHADRVA